MPRAGCCLLGNLSSAAILPGVPPPAAASGPPPPWVGCMYDIVEGSVGKLMLVVGISSPHLCGEGEIAGVFQSTPSPPAEPD